MDYDFETTTTSLLSDAESNTIRLYNFLIPILGIFVIVLNSLVVISSVFLLEIRTQSICCYMLLGNLGLANLLTGVAVVFGHYYPSRNDTSCAIQIALIVATTLVSVYSVLLVAIDRFLFILHGIRYHQLFYPQRVRLLIFLSWIIGGTIGVLVLFPSLRGSMYADKCWFILLTPGLVLATTIIGTVPILVVVVLYCHILYKALKKVSELKKKIRTERSIDENVRRQRKKPSKWKAIKIVMFTTGSFVCTWVPYFIVSTMYVYCDHENNPNFCYSLKIATIGPLSVLGFSNSVLNPIIYCWWHVGFRMNAIRVLSKRLEQSRWCRCCVSKNKRISSENNNRVTQSTAIVNMQEINNNDESPAEIES